MTGRFSDAEIADLLAERKPQPADYQKSLKFRDKWVHKEAELEKSQDEGEFRLIGRENSPTVPDFSIIIAVSPPSRAQIPRLVTDVCEKQFTSLHGNREVR